MTSSKGLIDRGVVITRPAHQTATLSQLLEREGARPILFPVLDIGPALDAAPLERVQPELSSFDLAFFVSPNAVDYAMAAVKPAVWPATLRLAVVGPASLAALRTRGFSDVLCPQDQFDSESVLQLPEFSPSAVAGKRVLILRGDGGRELLADTLRERGAHVECVAVYRRTRAQLDPQVVIGPYRQKRIDALSFTSSEGARYFAQILGEENKMLLSLPCFVPHPRIAQQLTVLGAQHIVQTDAGDAGLVAALKRHFG